jgi:hypothetical protein
MRLSLACGLLEEESKRVYLFGRGMAVDSIGPLAIRVRPVFVPISE